MAARIATAVACLMFANCLLLGGCEAPESATAREQRRPDFAGIAAGLTGQALPAAEGAMPAPERPARAEMLKRYWSGDVAWIEERLNEQQAALANPQARERAGANIDRMLICLTSAPRAYEVAERWESAQPGSYWAHVVLGRAYMEEGWRARGSELASETSSEQFAELDRWRRRAVETLTAALPLDSRPLSAIDGLLWCGLGYATQTERQKLADAALRILPESDATYRKLMHGLEPKWGGSMEAMRGLIERARSGGVPAAIVRGLEADAWLAETEAERRGNQRLRPAHYGKAAEISDRSGDWRWYGWALEDAVRPDEAERAFTRAIELDADNLDALNGRGNMLRKSGKIEEGFADVRKAAEAGHYGAQETLIRAYAYGNEGLPRDAAALPRWCELAASHGNAWGDFCIGGMYVDGLADYPRDRVRAVEYFRRAAEKGHSVAQHDYGWMLVRGDSVAADRAAGIRWLRAAASQGSDVAKDKLRALGEPIEKPADGSAGSIERLKKLLG